MSPLSTVRLETQQMKTFLFAKRSEAVVSTGPDTTICLLVIKGKPLFYYNKQHLFSLIIFYVLAIKLPKIFMFLFITNYSTNIFLFRIMSVEVI
jgi:hypothetical protein